MPDLIGISHAHPEWNDRLRRYWENISVLVPFEGLELNCSKIWNDDKNWKPANTFHYVLHKYCLEYSGVANQESDIGKSSRIRFYMWSPQEQLVKDKNERKLKDAATMARIEMQGDENMVKSILYIFDEFVSNDENNNLLKLANLVDKNPKQFLITVKDKNLMSKALIKRLINAGLLTQPVGSTVVAYEGTVVANNIDEAVIWLTDVKNQTIKVTLETKLAEKGL
jgi:hypothetical protein